LGIVLTVCAVRALVPQGEGEGEGDGSGAKGSRAGMETDARVIVTPFRPLNMGPYPQVQYLLAIRIFEG
jgi:hypothetical protein